MQNLYWIDKDELDIIDRTNNEEIQDAKKFYRVGQTVCINTSLGSCWGKILKMDNDKNTIDVWIKPKGTVDERKMVNENIGVMFQGKTIIHNVPIYALF